MMLSADASHLRKYMATLGIAVIAGTVSVSMLLMRLPDEVLVPQSEIVGLTTTAQETVERRQQYASFVTLALPWFLLVGVAIGLTICIYGLRGWTQRQKVTDELEDIAREKGRTELRILTDAERTAKVEAEANVEAVLEEEAEAEVVVSAEAGKVTPNGDEELGLPVDVGTVPPSVEPPQDQGGVLANRRERQTELAERTMHAELVLGAVLEEALRGTHHIDLGVEVSREGFRRVFDLVATPALKISSTFLFEIKYIRVVNNFPSALADAITQSTLGAAMIGADAVPVAVVVYAGSLPAEQLDRLQKRAELLSSLQTVPPRVLILSEAELEALQPHESAHSTGSAVLVTGHFPGSCTWRRDLGVAPSPRVELRTEEQPRIGRSGVDANQGADPVRPIVYPIADRPDVEVRVDGVWRCGQLRMWSRHDNGTWWAQVQWSRAPGETMLGSFPAPLVREVGG